MALGNQSRPVSPGRAEFQVTTLWDFPRTFPGVLFPWEFRDALGVAVRVGDKRVLSLWDYRGQDEAGKESAGLPGSERKEERSPPVLARRHSDPHGSCLPPPGIPAEPKAYPPRMERPEEVPPSLKTRRPLLGHGEGGWGGVSRKSFPT